MHVHISRLALFAPLAWASTLPRSNGEADFQCDLPAPIDPSGDGLPSARSLFSSEEALLKQVDRHGALVKVPSVCYDDLGPFDEDPRWAPFYDFHDVLAETFPLMYVFGYVGAWYHNVPGAWYHNVPPTDIGKQPPAL